MEPSRPYEKRVVSSRGKFEIPNPDESAMDSNQPSNTIAAEEAVILHCWSLDTYARVELFRD
jgi:hypothetical protein